MAPKLLEAKDVSYILSTAFLQDPLEAYFSKKCHKGARGYDNPTVQSFFYNTASIVQQRSVYRDLKTMNVSTTNVLDSDCDLPLPKRKKNPPKKECLGFICPFLFKCFACTFSLIFMNFIFPYFLK